MKGVASPYRFPPGWILFAEIEQAELTRLIQDRLAERVQQPAPAVNFAPAAAPNN